MALASRRSAVSRASVARAPAPRRARLTVVAQGKGGEEGGKTFGKDIVGILSTNANFILLASAIGKSGLSGALSGPGPYTIFAPKDDAFLEAAKKLKITKLELLNLPNLGDILKKHVVSGKVMSSQLTEGGKAKTLGGSELKFSLAGGAKVNGIKITKADFPAQNGVIHVVDQVLL